MQKTAKKKTASETAAPEKALKDIMARLRQQGASTVKMINISDIVVDERVIERYPWIPGPWSLFRTDSPAETRAVTGDHSVTWDR